MDIINEFVNTAVNFLNSYGLIVGVLLIILESIIPILPLSVFITLNVASYGTFIGVLISWISTLIGCSVSFILFRYFFRDKFYKFINKKELGKLSNIMNLISNIRFTNLAILIAIPFSPAFLINIAGGLSKISYKKFIIAASIGKSIMVYFWAYIGTSLLESLTNIVILLRIGALLLVAFIISTIVERKLKIK